MTKIYMRGGVYFGTAEDMIDRIEELEADLQDAHRVGAEWFEQSKQNHKQATTSEAKLVKAVEGLMFYADKDKWIREVPYLGSEADADSGDKARATLAELTGGKDE